MTNPWSIQLTNQNTSWQNAGKTESIGANRSKFTGATESYQRYGTNDDLQARLAALDKRERPPVVSNRTLGFA